MKPRVLVTYIESGMGHITSMQAIADSLNRNYSDRLDVVSDYIMNKQDITKKHEIFLTKQVQNTNKIRGLGQLAFFFLEVFGGRNILRFMYKTVFKKVMDSTHNIFIQHKPDVIVSTHFFITHAAVQYKKHIDPSVTIITYNPDNNTHVWWDNRDGYFFVNNSIAYDEAIKRKFDLDKVIQVSYAKRQALIEATFSKQYYRHKYDLPLDKFTVIIADGAYAMGRSKDFANALLATKLPLTILYIAGKNQQVYSNMLAKKKLIESRNSKPNITFKVYPFVPDIHELYKASDLFITKGGPNAVLDSLLMGTPVAINFCPQPMEEAALKLFVKKLGCGIETQNVFAIRRIVEEFIQNPKILDIFRKNAECLSNCKNGAEEIADFIVNKCCE